MQTYKVFRIDIYTNFMPYILRIRNTSIHRYYHRAMHMSYNFTRKFKKYVYRGMQQRQTCKPHAVAKYDTFKCKRVS